MKKQPKDRLTSKDFWTEYWQPVQSGGPPSGFVYLDEVLDVLPRHPGTSFLEIGCGPGGILGDFCRRLGYEAHGIDLATDPKATESYLRASGVAVGRIEEGDFLAWNPGRVYDVVTSFGFISRNVSVGRQPDEQALSWWRRSSARLC